MMEGGGRCWSVVGLVGVLDDTGRQAFEWSYLGFFVNYLITVDEFA